MARYKRTDIESSTYFFTLALVDQKSRALVTEISVIREAYAMMQARFPFYCDAWVILPNHLHAVLSLPHGDDNYASRLRCFKTRVARRLSQGRSGAQALGTTSQNNIWQKQRPKHCIKDPQSYSKYIRYCLTDPVRHGLCKEPNHWPFSTIHRDARNGKTYEFGSETLVALNSKATFGLDPDLQQSIEIQMN